MSITNISVKIVINVLRDREKGFFLIIKSNIKLI